MGGGLRLTALTAFMQKASPWRTDLRPSSSAEEVFRDGFHKVGGRHEDADGAEDGEDREGHQAEAVDDGCGKLPLAARRLLLVLVAETLTDESDLLQDLLQGGVTQDPSSSSCATSHSQKIFFNEPCTEGVWGGAAVQPLHPSEAHVEKVAIGNLWLGRDRHGADAELQAGEAAALALAHVVTCQKDFSFSRTPHA